MPFLETPIRPEVLYSLLFALTLKHFLGDFVFQTRWMARGKERTKGWFVPLCAHAGCHAVLTLGIALWIAPRLWWIALMEFVIHAAIDRGKSLISLRAKLTIEKPAFWWLFGFDQFLHQVTNIIVAASLVAGLQIMPP